jgi:hypothetical protein
MRFPEIKINGGENGRNAKTLLALIMALFLSGCVFKSVTLIGSEGIQYTGKIRYKDGYSGIPTIPQGPGGESFSGNYVVVDQTSINRIQGSMVVPQNNQMPAVGGISQVSSGQVNANGYWYGIGGKGTKIEGTMTIGLGGHGHGTCKDGNGKSYQIVF